MKNSEVRIGNLESGSGDPYAGKKNQSTIQERRRNRASAYPPLAHVSAQAHHHPVIWELGRKFPVVTNVRQASVTDEIGIVCLELSGPRAQIEAAIEWLEELGIKVEPVEIGVIES